MYDVNAYPLLIPATGIGWVVGAEPKSLVLFQISVYDVNAYPLLIPATGIGWVVGAEPKSLVLFQI